MLDIADLYRHDVTLDIAFGAAREAQSGAGQVERLVRRRAAKIFRQKAISPGMIDRIKTLVGPPEAPIQEEPAV